MGDGSREQHQPPASRSSPQNPAKATIARMGRNVLKRLTTEILEAKNASEVYNDPPALSEIYCGEDPVVK